MRMRLVLPKKINNVQGSIKNFDLDGILCMDGPLLFVNMLPTLLIDQFPWCEWDGSRECECDIVETRNREKYKGRVANEK